ncbi:helix-turn-helix domain-containing protein [Natrialbaceae archaeon AArc-T1-2]|nr:helix-turn-helix domain-containing protein [Natrialbaceae archaeon AArc-T1-2]WIV68693.1 helix-turn-helix domain-containing protein [Natrialbaceae archaeon AArc-T1-2]
MSLIAEYELSNPILRGTRRALPDLQFQVEDEQLSRSELPKLVFWTTGDERDLERLEDLLADDPTVDDVERLAALGGRRLYRVALTEVGVVGMTYQDAVELGITFLDIRVTGEPMQYRAQVPTREALFAYRERCRDRGLSFRLVGLYEGKAEPTNRYGVTDRQREVLLAALEHGYFDVPRGTTLEELAAELDASGQALSALLRRGQANLLRHTLAADGT